MSMKDIEVKANSYFTPDLTDRERAVFEGAIALGALYHQFTGVPISKNDRVIHAVESCIEACISLQPYKEKVEVKIDKDTIRGEKSHPFDYETLKGKHLDVKVTSRFRKAKATLRMRFIQELNYTLMYVESVEEEP